MLPCSPARIRREAALFRRNFLTSSRRRWAGEASGCQIVAGRCIDLSLALGKHLRQHCAGVQVVHGTVDVDRPPRFWPRKVEHFWIRVGGLDVDLTADQFNKAMQAGREFPGVLIGRAGSLAHHTELAVVPLPVEAEKTK